MITAKQREEEFRQELKALLEKHNAEIEVTDDGRDYGMHRGIAVVWMSTVFDADWNVVAEYTDFEL